MRQRWLARKGCGNLIIFFNGWGLDSNPFSGLCASGADVLMINDYSSQTLPGLDTVIKDYKSIYIICYSFGVAAMMLNPMEIKKVISRAEGIYAINGTLAPVDDRFGIKKAIFERTLKSIADEGTGLFYRNMFDKEAHYDEFMRHKPERSINSQVDELNYFSREFTDFIPGNVCYKKAMVSEKDRIFFSVNQFSFWESVNVKSISIEGGHFPFYKWKSWDQILSDFINE